MFNKKIENILLNQITDGEITIKPFNINDAEAHLAGDDEENEKWLSGGKSNLETVSSWILKNQKSWESNGPVFNFAIWSNERKLVGMVEANVDVPGLKEGDVNISYAIYPEARGNSYATKAVNLLLKFLKQKGLNRAVIRIERENIHSIKIPHHCGFKENGTVVDKEGKEMLLFTKKL